MKFKSVAAAFALAGLSITLPASAADKVPKASIEQVAQFGHQATGVTVSEKGRIFVNFPRWTEDSPVSVAEVMKDGSMKPYPDAGWNAWRNVSADDVDPAKHFVCVQSVVADGRGSLWVLDPAAPANNAIVPGGPKLVQIDLASNTVKRVIAFDQTVAIPGSYMNDIRFSADGKFGYITDSGQRGSLVVLDMASGKARRVLDGDMSTQPEKGVQIHFEGKEVRYPDGRKVQFAADSIALAPDGWLYWKPLTGKKLYRIQTSVLQSKGYAGQDVSGDVQPFGETGPSDGFWIGDKSTKSAGNLLYVTSPETNAISVRDLTEGPSGQLRTVVQDNRLRWPDTFGQGPDGTIYVTTSRIPDSAFFHKDAPPALPTQLWRLKMN